MSKRVGSLWDTRKPTGNLSEIRLIPMVHAQMALGIATILEGRTSFQQGKHVDKAWEADLRLGAFFAQACFLCQWVRKTRASCCVLQTQKEESIPFSGAQGHASTRGGVNIRPPLKPLGFLLDFRSRPAKRGGGFPIKGTPSSLQAERLRAHPLFKIGEPILILALSLTCSGK